MERKKSEFDQKENPYDTWLDEYEEDLTQETVHHYFSELKEQLLPLLKKVRKEFLAEKKELTYDKEKLELLNKKILSYMGFDETVSRIDEYVHPFSTGNMSTTDVRITTAYRKDFDFTILSSIHEYGHAMYELGSDIQLNMTPAIGGTSLIIHESQSRFWENFF